MFAEDSFHLSCLKPLRRRPCRESGPPQSLQLGPGPTPVHGMWPHGKPVLEISCGRMVRSAFLDPSSALHSEGSKFRPQTQLCHGGGPRPRARPRILCLLLLLTSCSKWILWVGGSVTVGTGIVTGASLQSMCKLHHELFGLWPKIKMQKNLRPTRKRNCCLAKGQR